MERSGGFMWDGHAEADGEGHNELMVGEAAGLRDVIGGEERCGAAPLVGEEAHSREAASGRGGEESSS